MSFNNTNLEHELLETAAGQAVYDALVQANVNLCTVPLEIVKQMLLAECRFRIGAACNESEPLLAACS